MADYITDYELDRYAESCAKEIFDAWKEENPDDDITHWRAVNDMQESASEYADQSAYVIYTNKALQICAHCNTDLGESFMDDVGMPAEPSLASIASLIAYGELKGRIEEQIQVLVDEESDK